MKMLLKTHKQQNGMVLIIAMIVVMLCSLVVVALLNFMGTGLKNVVFYNQKTNQLYAADAAMQLASWKVTYDPQVLADRANLYYGTYSYSYPTIPEINNNNVSLQLSAQWLFGYLFKIVPGETPHSGALVTSSSTNNGVFTLNYSNPTQNPIVIQKFGIWLPPGCNYAGGASGITSLPPTQETILGGTNVIWDVNYSLPKYSTALQQFNYSPVEVDPFAASSWVFPQQQSVGASWDDSIWWYTATSTATDNSGRTTSIEGIIVSDNSSGTMDCAIINYLID